MTDRTLILMWDDNGLEQLHDISAFDEESEAKVFAILAGTEPPPDSFPNIMPMRLRAMYNTPRNYKIYGIKLQSEITDEIIEAAMLPENQILTHGKPMSMLKGLIMNRGYNLN